ncbi:NADH-quinone oxidoreductase subunit A [Helicobacter valdiviensis]|uniref:NADH-quinone oxidoreductase subunit A n=1 Tax=Helicobacter valdiviensis TaxID=1458358 RepID=A0A2W6MTW2_9HELI|nr:NAD(P)H-quinone oxidoreductase subunit 3 [Helicobacter valdiviensis]PZT47944.1 NADH-quinone oxidoreductase subunit A [Helicobacter valdiviensis]
MSQYSLAHPYFGVFAIFVFTFVAFFATTFLSRFVGRKLANKNTQKLKLSPYECGLAPTKQPNRISSQFYLMALLFILFDVEVIFMFPWAVDFKILGVFGFVEMILFVLLLVIGYVYAWRKGALQWQSIK